MAAIFPTTFNMHFVASKYLNFVLNFTVPEGSRGSNWPYVITGLCYDLMLSRRQAITRTNGDQEHLVAF